MCGIIGQINFNKEEIISEPLLMRMRDTMVHRGPDDCGVYIDKNVGLAFRRLSIIDLSKLGSQPMSNEEKTVWIIFNGEIYNFQDYRAQLEKKGRKFRSSTDTEVIIHLYEEYGLECFKKMNGMFALAILDKNKDRLILARDRFGVKPLYYSLDRKKLIFASEIKAIVSHPEVPRKINLKSLTEYFSFGYVLPPSSIFSGINKINPAGYKIFDLKKNIFIEEKKYWQLNFKTEQTFSFAEWQDRFTQKFKEAVKARLVSDVPLGVFLSGGVDSSSVVAAMSALGRRGIKTFSIGFEDERYNETKYSRFIAEKYKTDHRETIIRVDAIDILPQLSWYYDEPFDDSSALPTYYLSKITRGKVTVALSGDGGDELLAGYPRYRDFNKLYLKYLKLLPEPLRKIVFGSVQKIYPERFKGKRLLYLMSLTKFQAYEEFMKNFNNTEIGNLFVDDVYKNIGMNFDDSLWSGKIDLVKKTGDSFITGLQYLDSMTYLPGDILEKVDKASMANSLEVRSPFLDYQLWELVFSMPEENRFRNNQGKYILKEIMSKEFGKEFVYREKMGFGVPLDYWFRGKLKKYAQDTLLGKRFLGRGYFNKDYINKILSIHKAGYRDFSRKIWSLLFFENWCRNWVD